MQQDALSSIPAPQLMAFSISELLPSQTPASCWPRFLCCKVPVWCPASAVCVLSPPCAQLLMLRQSSLAELRAPSTQRCIAPPVGQVWFPFQQQKLCSECWEVLGQHSTVSSRVWQRWNGNGKSSLMAFVQRGSAVTLGDPWDELRLGLEDVFEALQTPSALLRVVSSLWRSSPTSAAGTW